MNETLTSRTGSALAWQGIQFAGVKVIHFVRLVVLARLLLPEDFGLIAISAIAIGFLLAVTNPGMLPALVQKDTPGERDYDAAWTVGMVRALVVAVPLIVAAPWIADLFQEPRATPLIRVLAVQPILDAAMSMRIARLVRDLDFRKMAGVHLSEAFVNTAISIALAPFVGVWALVWGPLAGSLASVVVSYLVAPYRPRLTLEGAVVRPLIVYGRWIFLAGILGVGTTLVIQLAVSRQLGATELGLYFLAGKLAFLAWEASNALVEKVVFPVYARLQEDPREAQRTFRFFLTAVAAFLVPASAVMIVVAPGLVESVLGTRWEGTVSLIRILSVVVMVGLVGDAIVPLLLGFGRPWGPAILEGIQLAVVSGSIWFLLGRFGVEGAALALLVAVGGSQMVGIMLARRVLPAPFSGLGPAMLAVAAATATASAVAWTVDQALPGAVGVGTAIVTAALAVAALLWRLDRRLKLGLLAELGRLMPGAASTLGRILQPRNPA